MPSVFAHLHSLLEVGLVVRLELPLLDGDLERAAVRSTRGGTLAAAIQELGEATAEYDVERLAGRTPSPRFFKGNERDVSKLSCSGMLAKGSDACVREHQLR